MGREDLPRMTGEEEMEALGVRLYPKSFPERKKMTENMRDLYLRLTPEQRRLLLELHADDSLGNMTRRDGSYLDGWLGTDGR